MNCVLYSVGTNAGSYRCNAGKEGMNVDRITLCSYNMYECKLYNYVVLKRLAIMLCTVTESFSLHLNNSLKLCMFYRVIGSDHSLSGNSHYNAVVQTDHILFL